MLHLRFAKSKPEGSSLPMHECLSAAGLLRPAFAMFETSALVVAGSSRQTCPRAPGRDCRDFVDPEAQQTSAESSASARPLAARRASIRCARLASSGSGSVAEADPCMAVTWYSAGVVRSAVLGPDGVSRARKQSEKAPQPAHRPLSAGPNLPREQLSVARIALTWLMNSSARGHGRDRAVVALSVRGASGRVLRGPCR